MSFSQDSNREWVDAVLKVFFPKANETKAPNAKVATAALGQENPETASGN